MNQQNNDQGIQEPNLQQQQNNSQEAQQLQNDNQNEQPNQNQAQHHFFWRNIPYSEQQTNQRTQLENFIEMIDNTPNDRFIYRSFLEKICHKFQQFSLKDYDDVLDLEQLHKIIDEQYNKRKQEQESKLSETPNLFNDWNDKVKLSQLFQVMKIIKSPNRSLYLTKDLTKENFFDEIKENLNPEELECLNNKDGTQETLKGLGIFNNFKVQPIEVFKKQLNLIKQQPFQNEDHLLGFEIYKILAFPYLYFNQCENYDVKTQSVHFQLPKNMNIEVRSNEKEYIHSLNENSILNMIPSYLLQSNILPFLGIIDVFKLRIVSRYFKTIVEKFWYIPYQKEIINQEIARDLAYNIELLKNFQVAAEALKSKLRACVEMIMNFINWQDLHQQIEAGQIEIEVYRPLIMMLRLFNKQQTICQTYEINGQLSITQLAKDIKQQILDYLNLELLLPLSIAQMKHLQLTALSAPEFNIQGLIHPEVSLSQLLTFLLQALYFHGWMHQIITLYKELLKKRKNELKILDEKQNYNKDFTKQACKIIYKMIDFSPSKDTEEQTEIMSKIDQKLKESLREINFSVDANLQSHPSAVIYQKNDVIKIHLDIYCQIELLTYVCARQKYYFQDVVDQKQENQSNKVEEIKNKEQSHFPIQEEFHEDQEEQCIQQQSEKIDLQIHLNHQENEPN